MENNCRKITAAAIILLAAAVSMQTCFAGTMPGDSLHVPEGVKAASYNWHKIKVSWQKSSDADGYAVYRASSRDGNYKRVYITENPEKNWYINTNRTTGKTYYYKVKSFQLKDGKRQYSPSSAAVSARARPVKVKHLQVETGGFRGGWFMVKWNPVSGADGYQVSIKDDDSNAWIQTGLFTETEAEIKIPDTSSSYQVRVRAYCCSRGKKVWGLYSEPKRYTFDWNPEMLKKAGEEILREKWPEISLKEKNAAGELKTPYNGTTWYALWPLRCCRYEAWSEVRKKLEEKITAAMELGEGGLDGVCFFIDSSGSENWIELYMLC